MSLSVGTVPGDTKASAVLAMNRRSQAMFMAPFGALLACCSAPEVSCCGREKLR